jgi:hypothetical protein
VGTKYKTECYKRQISYALWTQDDDSSKVFDLCGTVEGGLGPTCYESLGREVSWRSVSDVDQTKSTCMLGEDYEARSNCVVGVIKGYFSYYDGDRAKAQAKEFCEALGSDLYALCLQTGDESSKTFGAAQDGSLFSF